MSATHRFILHRAPIPEEEPIPGEEPEPEDDPVPHPDPVIIEPEQPLPQHVRRAHQPLHEDRHP